MSAVFYNLLEQYRAWVLPGAAVAILPLSGGEEDPVTVVVDMGNHGTGFPLPFEQGSLWTPWSRYAPNSETSVEETTYDPDLAVW